MISNDATILNIKHEVLYEVAKLAFAGTLEERKEELPFEMIPGPKARFRCCVYKEREVIRQRIALAEGKPPLGKQSDNIVPVSYTHLGIKAVDDKTLEFTLKSPCPYFVDLVSMWVYFPVQEATIEANGDKWTNQADTYICNGPFKITDMKMGESVVLEKNENYWDADNVTLQKLTYRYILDTSTALTAYENGEVDGVRTIPASDLARLEADNAGVVTAPSYGTVYYNINCSVAPYDNPLVRKALCLAIDRDSLINNVAQLDAQPAYSFLAPGYVVDGKDVTDGRSDFELSSKADPEAAKAALAEAGYPDGKDFPTVKLTFYSDDNVKKIAEAIKEMWEQNLGITVEVSSADWAVYYLSLIHI